jgi:hypothetical protein
LPIFQREINRRCAQIMINFAAKNVPVRKVGPLLDKEMSGCAFRVCHKGGNNAFQARFLELDVQIAAVDLRDAAITELVVENAVAGGKVHHFHGFGVDDGGRLTLGTRCGSAVGLPVALGALPAGAE